MELDKKRFSIRRHITLVLTLLTVLIVLLISAMLAVGVRFAVRTYRESMDQRGGFLFKPADPHAGKPACHPGILYHQPGAEQ